MIGFIPCIVTVMILYDLSIHIVYLFGKENFFLERHLHWWPKWDLSQNKGKRQYQIFWTSFWGIAFLLMLTYVHSSFVY